MDISCGYLTKDVYILCIDYYLEKLVKHSTSMDQILYRLKH